MARYVENETTSRSTWAPLAIIIALILLALAAWIIFANRQTSNPSSNSTSTSTATSPGTTQQVTPASNNPPGNSNPGY